ncbi:MAG: hypothetical protein NT069_23880 [Planctomycetota bacterium]|nr:hypothetical protein [Planctomycetota bacterium]
MSRGKRLASHGDAMIRVRLNLKMVFGLLVVAVTTVTAAHFLREYWIVRNAEGLMQRADQSYAEGEVVDAIQIGSQYLRLRPQDADAILKVTEWVEESPAGTRTLVQLLNLMEDFLVKNPTHKKVRRRAIELSVVLQRFEQVISVHLPYVEADLGTDSELLGWVITCHESLSNFSAASRLFLTAIELSPTRPSNYAGLAQLVELHELDFQDLREISAKFGGTVGDTDLPPKFADPDSPDQPAEPLDEPLPDRDVVIQTVLDAMLGKAVPEVESRIIRAKYFFRQERLDAAELELQLGADSTQDENLDLVILQVEAALKRRDLARFIDDDAAAKSAASRANDLLERFLNRDDPDWRICVMMGRVKLEERDTIQAETHLRHAVAIAEKLANELPKTLEGRRDVAAMLFRVRWALANALIARAYDGDTDPSDTLQEIERIKQAFRSSNVLPAIIDFLEVRQILAKRQWHTAAVELDKLRPRLDSIPEARRSVDEGLIDCYTRLQNPDKKIQAITRAINEDRFWYAGRIILAETYAENGQEDRAIEEYRLLRNLVRLPIAATRLELRQVLRQPPEKRNWTRIEEAVDALVTANPGIPELISLRAEILFHQAKYDAALEAIHEARMAQPQDETLAEMLAVITLNRRDLPLAQRLSHTNTVLNSLQGLESAGLCILRGEVITLLKSDSAGADLLALGDSVESWPRAKRDKVYRGLAAHALDAGMTPESLAFTQRSLALNPLSVELLTQVALLGIPLDLDELVTTHLRQLLSVEGESGPNYQFVAGMADIGALAQLEKTKNEEVGASYRDKRIRLLRSAELHFRSSTQSRPSWAIAHRYLGRVLSELGESDLSLAEYRTALRYGDTSKETQIQIVGFLQRMQRDDEIIEVIRQIEDYSPMVVPEEVARVGMQAAYRSRQWDEAFSRSGKLGSSTYADKIIRAQILMARRENPEEVETLLRGATELGKDQAMAWYLRVAFYLREYREADAQAVIEEATTQVPAEPPYLRPYILAICRELAGEMQEAHRQFHLAHQMDTRNLPQLNEHINFCLRHNRPDDAKLMLQLIADPKSGLDEDLRRRTQIFLAQLRATTATNYKEFEEALSALGADQDLKSVSGTNLKAQAQVYSRSRMRKDQLRLIRVLEELGSREKLSPAESLQLALLYEQHSRWSEAWLIYRRLMVEDPTDLTVVANFVQGGNSQKHPDNKLLGDLDKAVGTMLAYEGDSFRTLVARVRLLALRSQNEDAVVVLDTFLNRVYSGQPTEMFRELIRIRSSDRVVKALESIVATSDDSQAKFFTNQIQRLTNGNDDGELIATLRKYIERPEIAEVIRSEFVKLVAVIFETLELNNDAERVYLQLRDRFKSQEGAVTLSAFYARRGRVREALAIADELEGKLSSAVLARVLVAVIRAGKADEETCAGVEKSLLDRLRQSEESGADDFTELSVALADLYDYLQRYPEAMAIYSGLLRRNENNVLALNNLAWIVSFDQATANRDKGLALIDRAIQVAGPIADLLDTRAIVRLNTNQFDEAVVDLQTALDEIASPAMWFHLAVAQFRAKNLRGASESMERAASADFDPETLHPLERGFYDELRTGLNLTVKSKSG